MLDFPLQFFVRFFKNHGLLSVNNRPQWCVIEGGSSRYIEPLTRSFREQIRLDCPVHLVERDAEGVIIYSAAGTEAFDKVVFACHSDQALALLGDPSQAEREILGAWASWNYRLSGDTQTQAEVTYDMNILQGIDSATTFCVSLNQTSMINPLKILARYTYAHPQYSLAAVAAQARWKELNGTRHTWYCGAYWANGFHEDGVVSALRVAEAFGESL
jgi:predicted NAD/FAD-binding protein